MRRNRTTGSMQPVARIQALGAVLALGLLAGCSAQRPPAPPPGAAPLSLQWQREAAEHQAIYRQTLRLAGDRLAALAAGREPGTWAVVADADETLIDNSLYAVERWRIGEDFSEESWTAWVQRREAPALPGALEFATRVRELGGHLVVVTNRAAHECPDTAANLATLGMEVAAVLCRPAEGPGDKNPRFSAVLDGTAAPGLPPLEVLLYLGDNIRDFPGGSQDLRGEELQHLFGDRWFVLPNPLYGSWQERTVE